MFCKYVMLSSTLVSGGLDLDGTGYIKDSIWSFDAVHEVWTTTNLTLGSPNYHHAVTVIDKCPGEQKIHFLSFKIIVLTGTDTGNIRINSRNITLVNETVVSENVRFVITMEGLLSLALVQLPGICLGVFGIMKAVINHGMSTQAVRDSLRSFSCS